MSPSGQLLHATCIALPVGESWFGLLLLGPSGCGKSDFGLRLIERGARLVADDQTQLGVVEGKIWATAPASIAGRLEIRGVGIVELPASRRLDRVEVAAAVELRGAPEIERLPDPDQCHLLGVDLPCWQLAPFQDGALMRAELALEATVTAQKALAGAVAGRQATGTAAGRRRVLLVTGLSGAGRVTALKALEDLGYVALDNMPMPLIDRLLHDQADGERFAVAFGVDVRTWGFDSQAMAARLAHWRAQADLAVDLVYLDCDTEILLRRYTETRRPHPLAGDRPVQDAIADERRRLAPLRDLADRTIDTSTLSPHDLKRLLGGHFALDAGRRLRLALVSFSYSRGLPREADMVFDARFLRNPHYVPQLRPMDGRDPAVRDFVAADPAWSGFLNRLETLLTELLPLIDAEGRSYLTIAIGCTGGRHRSVAVANELALRLRRLGREVAVAHRDVMLASGPPDTAHSPGAMSPPLPPTRPTASESVR